MKPPRWLWFAPFGILVVMAGIWGMKLGQQRANLTTTQVINFYADRYIADHTLVIGPGALRTQCIAVPGSTADIWIEVRCTPPGGEPGFVYGATHSGALAYGTRDGAIPET